MNTRKVSIKDIAKICGVSVSTVSRVINNNGRFSEETRQRVVKAIKKYNYKTNTAAKTLRMQKSNAIGILVPDLANSFFSNLVENLEKNFFIKGYSTMICDTGRDKDRELTYLKMLEAKVVDGLIVISGSRKYNPDIIDPKIPVICIDRSSDSPNVTYIGSNHEQGARMATAKLIEAGTTPILLCSSNQKISSTKDRIRGYQIEMKSQHLSDNDCKIVAIKSHKSNIDQRGIEIRSILRNMLNEQNLPIGIFAISDTIAAEVTVAAHELELNIPRDLKVIGFDDAPIAKYCYPQLTTIRQNTQEIVDKTSTLLLQMIQGDNSIRQNREIIDVDLIERGTV
ncbi:LacI family DNA-binding transcriptional regulator [Xylocopilactobacillus apis]|uniref:LacI family transcriptional regulator n=1 Tax=Xylocopilactobacillus apis TaxID=2932183 RepID=A0AAU9D8C6_9LACO|nr:LacI family DNA-binding transcriptional regulator [Xylocopilactobacillus apis]BDR55920.1 LacI family transcriptional regulator [Xylocopilactobacillus apis]